ncbi:sugar ABC transporter permease [Clostridium sp. YIM B02515]|uniref:Sugar ABC transporter permease n=1 Tax=Clostridium rhizosphaerae TaxID=2803861 RepID=A0ABS1TCH2_9CLOT|nr:sugar ABC transporter permease [Clostridium rhizosphaerae]
MGKVLQVSKKTRELKIPGVIKKNMSGWLIMAPTLILFAFFVWEPLLASIRLSLYSAKGMRTVEFVGLKNYIDVFHHPDFFPAVRNTFSYTIWSLLIGFLVPIIMAVIINEMVHAKGLFRVGIYFPNIVPGLATVMMWAFIFRPGKTGVLNIILGNIGVQPQVWLSNPKITIPLIVLTMTWKGAGATALIYLAALQGINPELYEAAIIDGAGIWKRIVHVTVPNLKNLIRSLLILQVISVFQILYEPLVMTNGGPNNASISIMQLVFKYAFEKFDYPKAAAVSVIISLFLVTLTAVYNKFSKEQDI